jgi:hypothetical protein
MSSGKRGNSEERIWFLVLAGVAVLLIACVVYLRPSEPRYTTYCEGCPETLEPTRIDTDYRVGGAAYTVSVATSEKHFERVGTRPAWNLAHHVYRITVTCNGRVLADLAPQMPINPDMKAVGFWPGEPSADKQDGPCAANFSVGLGRPQRLVEGGGVNIGFERGGYAVLDERPAGLPLAPARVRTQFGLPWGLDVGMNGGRVTAVALTGCAAPRAAVPVDRSAPKGAFGLWLTASPTLSCPESFVLGFDPGDPAEARALLFERGRVVKEGMSGDGMKVLSPPIGRLRLWMMSREEYRRGAIRREAQERTSH